MAGQVRPLEQNRDFGGHPVLFHPSRIFEPPLLGFPDGKIVMPASARAGMLRSAEL